MKGIAYGVGVGPGDPELMTLKACRLIRENDVIALPGKEPKETVAYQIAVKPPQGSPADCGIPGSGEECGLSDSGRFVRLLHFHLSAALSACRRI